MPFVVIPVKAWAVVFAPPFWAGVATPGVATPGGAVPRIATPRPFVIAVETRPSIVTTTVGTGIVVAVVPAET
jgi:hypothetical protein